MPKVRSIGTQSAMRDEMIGGRLAVAFRPSSVSCKPRRRNHPNTQNKTLAMNGARQPHLATWSALMEVFTNQAEPEPSMNPIVVPAAVELLTMPRVIGEADSVVKTMEPVNSPPTEKP